MDEGTYVDIYVNNYMRHAHDNINTCDFQANIECFYTIVLITPIWLVAMY